MPEPGLPDRQRVLADDYYCRQGQEREEYEHSGLISEVSTHVR
jgi:hypothetical protein